jgi:hypothetical protein
MKRSTRNALGMLFLSALVVTPATGAGLTHGPIVGHTMGHSTRIWARADGPAEFQVRVRSVDGRQFKSAIVGLKEEDNFCGTVDVDGLTPDTTYGYVVLLDGMEQRPRCAQSVTTLPPANHPARVRIGFGHSIIGSGEQTTWRAIYWMSATTARRTTTRTVRKKRCSATIKRGNRPKPLRIPRLRVGLV